MLVCAVGWRPAGGLLRAGGINSRGNRPLPLVVPLRPGTALAGERGIFLVQSLETAKVNYSECAVHRAWSEVDFRRCKSRLLHFVGRTSALLYFGSFACPAIDERELRRDQNHPNPISMGALQSFPP